MATLRFLQISDVHLDSSLAAGRLGLPAEKVRRRQGEIRAVLAGACALARERAADVVLIPGDLFDDESISLDTVNFVVETFGSIAPIPIVVAPGNHDFYSLGSPYNAELLAARRQAPWPANVKIFAEPHWTSFRLPGRPDVAVTGMAHAGGAAIGERLLSRPIPRDEEAALRILLFHGSRENTEIPKGKIRTLPFSDAELEAAAFDWAAIGHYHHLAVVHDAAGRPIGAYAGCPAGRGLDETGPRHVLLGEITRGPDGATRIDLERMALDTRRIHLVEVPCTGLAHRDAVLRRAEDLLAVRECRPDDLVCLRLTGRVAPGVDLRLPEGYLADRFFHATVDASRLKPAYDLERYRRDELRTTEARFAREMLRRLEAATDPAERRRIENALYYGLDALVQKEVAPRYEE